jgi:hypothetical protein
MADSRVKILDGNAGSENKAIYGEEASAERSERVS